MYFPSLRIMVVRRDVNFYGEKAMRFSLERELHLHSNQDILAQKEEHHEVVE